MIQDLQTERSEWETAIVALGRRASPDQPRRGSGSDRQLHVRQGSDRLPRQAAIAGEGISNHFRLEAMGAEPADLFFAKERSGAQLQVRIDRTRGQPHFERDREK